MTMLQTRLGEDGNLWLAGETKTATDAFARLLVSSNLATATFHEVPQSALTAAQVQAVQAMAAVYDYQPATWHAGEINSVVTPSITADGDLTSATDQVPLKWLAVINADDDVAAAQALLDGGPNVVEILPGAQAQPIVYADDGVTPEVITRIYAVCISSSAVPANYTGGAYILSDADTAIANALTNMARFDFSSGLGATVARLIATPVYNTHFTQLSVAAGVVA
ncbi:MAG: hypothetical protein KDF67_15160 [Ottowia sp.]|nr:hypothetical protein [Ottowia sp.]